MIWWRCDLVVIICDLVVDCNITPFLLEGRRVGLKDPGRVLGRRWEKVLWVREEYIHFSVYNNKAACGQCRAVSNRQLLKFGPNFK